MAVLLLKRMKYDITFKELGEAIHDVLQKFEIYDRTVLCTTDNGSNFLKSFR